MRAILERVKEGANIKEIISEFPEVYMKYPTGIKDTYNNFKIRQKRTKPLSVVVHWGVPGGGKSFEAEEFGRQNPDKFFRWTAGAKDARGYRGESHVLIDEFDRGYIEPGVFKQILDEYDSTGVSVPFTSVAWCPEKIWVCANTHPLNWYGGDETIYQAVVRRCDYIDYFGQKHPAQVQKELDGKKGVFRVRTWAPDGSPLVEEVDPHSVALTTKNKFITNRDRSKKKNVIPPKTPESSPKACTRRSRHRHEVLDATQSRNPLSGKHDDLLMEVAPLPHTVMF